VRPVIPPTRRTVEADTEAGSRSRAKVTVGTAPAGTPTDSSAGATSRTHRRSPGSGGGVPGRGAEATVTLCAGPREEKPLRTENQWRPTAAGTERVTGRTRSSSDASVARASPRSPRVGP
jgi:hypothetical protein